MNRNKSLDNLGFSNNNLTQNLFYNNNNTANLK
jgi:hypothetical protein